MARLIALSTAVLAFGCGMTIFLRGHISDVLLSLMLQYLLTLNNTVMFLLIYWGDIEKKMVSVQRLLNLDDIAQERN